MPLKSRNIVAAYLVVLILFSTIGFNIISTFCDGCKIEHTSIALTPIDNDGECNCCRNNYDSNICCSTTYSHGDKEHETKSTLAQLKFDSPEAKSELFNVDAPVFLLHFVSILLNTELFESNNFHRLYQNSSPPLSGRMILSLICILRN